MEEQKYYIKISPEVIKNKIAHVIYTASTETVLEPDLTCCDFTAFTPVQIVTTGITDVLLSMQQILSGGTDGISILTGLTYSTLGTPPSSTFNIAFVGALDAFKVVGSAGLVVKAKNIPVIVYVVPDFRVTVLAAPEILIILSSSTVNPNVDGDVIVVGNVLGVIKSVVAVSCEFKFNVPPNISIYLKAFDGKVVALNVVVAAALFPANLITQLELCVTIPLV